VGEQHREPEAGAAVSARRHLLQLGPDRAATAPADHGGHRRPAKPVQLYREHPRLARLDGFGRSGHDGARLLSGRGGRAREGTEQEHEQSALHATHTTAAARRFPD
jgi:hypothetical protein